MMLNALLLFLCQCGFFKRSKYEDSVPKYHAVRIRKETRLLKDGQDMLDPLEKKQWMTTWNENESYSWDCLCIFCGQFATIRHL